jgi:hypothetical protein
MTAMNKSLADKGDVVIQRLVEMRFAFAVDGLVRYVGSQVECERRAAILVHKTDRGLQDQVLSRWVSLGG